MCNTEWITIATIVDHNLYEIMQIVVVQRSNLEGHQHKYAFDSENELTTAIEYWQLVKFFSDPPPSPFQNNNSSGLFLFRNNKIVCDYFIYRKLYFYTYTDSVKIKI